MIRSLSVKIPVHEGNVQRVFGVEKVKAVSLPSTGRDVLAGFLAWFTCSSIYRGQRAAPRLDAERVRMVEGGNTKTK